MSKSTISTFELFQMFPDQESARLYLESRLWPDGVTCPTCRKGERITTRKGGYYRCNACNLDFTVRTGTIFERSHIPLHKWLYAMYLLVTARKGISSLQLSKEIGVTQKSAWFMLQRLREACGTKIEKLRGLVEIDETYVGGKEANKHANLKLNRGDAGRGHGGRRAVRACERGRVGQGTRQRRRCDISRSAVQVHGPDGQEHADTRARQSAAGLGVGEVAMTDTGHDITPDELIEIEERAAIMTEHLDGKYGDTVYKHLIATAVKAQREGRTHADESGKGGE